jgi:hypothetical protein
MLFVTSAKSVIRVLIAIVLFLTLAGLGVRFIKYILVMKGSCLYSGCSMLARKQAFLRGTRRLRYCFLPFSSL